MMTFSDPPEFEKLARVLANQKRMRVTNIAAVLALAAALLAVLLSVL